MQSELKPCPFCGGKPEYHSDKGPTGEVYAWVGCNQCDAMSVHCDVRSMQPEETHPIEAWNTRASDAENTRLAEALRAAEEREKGLREALCEILDLPGEINPSNYDHDDACELNRQFCYGAQIARQALAGAKP